MKIQPSHANSKQPDSLFFYKKGVKLRISLNPFSWTVSSLIFHLLSICARSFLQSPPQLPMVILSIPFIIKALGSHPQWSLKCLGIGFTNDDDAFWISRRYLRSLILSYLDVKPTYIKLQGHVALYITVNISPYITVGKVFSPLNIWTSHTCAAANTPLFWSSCREHISY